MLMMTKFSWPLIAARMSELVQYAVAFEIGTAAPSAHPVESCTSSTAIILLSLHHWMICDTCVPLLRAHWPPVASTTRTTFEPVAAMFAKSCWTTASPRQLYQVYG